MHSGLKLNIFKTCFFYLFASICLVLFSFLALPALAPRPHSPPLAGHPPTACVQARTPYACVRGPPHAPPARRLLERLRAEVFSPGGIETIQAVLQIERGLRLSWQAVPVAALQQLMTMLQHLYPNYASRVLVVNLPSYLAWFVRFVKGMLDEVTAAKVELIDGGVEGLRHYYTTEGLPAYYRDLGG